MWVVPKSIQVIIDHNESWVFVVPKRHRQTRLMSTKKIFEKSSFESAAPPPMPGSEAFLDAQEVPEDTEGAPGWADEDGGSYS